MPGDIAPEADPATILKAIPGLTAPQFRTLKSSDLGRVIFVEAQEGWYVLRLPAHRGLGINRKIELAIHRAMAAEGLAPPVVWANPVSGALLTPWQRGGVWRKDPCTGKDLETLGHLLRRVHQSTIDAPPINYESRLHGYLTSAACHFDAAAMAPLRSAVTDLVHCIMSTDERPGLCHHDPLRPNIVCDESDPLLIDWEYAATGDVRFDLAAVCLDHDLDRQGRATLLGAYGTEVNDTELLSFSLLCRLTEELWYGAQGEPMNIGNLLDDISRQVK